MINSALFTNPYNKYLCAQSTKLDLLSIYSGRTLTLFVIKTNQGNGRDNLIYY